ncbi:sulfotransferase family protein [Nonomuraea sp. NPDC047897]|uniref:sulfotransferase family protein n=1 Tax=Nonomuraea sp. NPDC047897 TaxID=3364346 RepID=UPI0037104801
MVEVIGAGLPRTGTTSMKVALERLGFAPCYHMAEVMTHPEHVDRWVAAAAGQVRTREDWDRVFDGGYRATQDWPAAHFWRELAGAYPEAKVVLTVRDPRAWYPSMRMLTSGGPRPDPAAELPEPVRRALTAMDRMRPVLDLMGGSHFGPGWRFGTGLADEEQAVAAFERHVAAVRDSVPAERLLVFDVREGWGPLCAFLGVAVPAGEPFPHLNDAASMRRAFDRMSAGDPSFSLLDELGR